MSVPGKIKLLIPVAVLLLVVLTVRWNMSRSAVATDDRIFLYGNIDIREVQLSFKDSERIAQILVEEGDQVDEGDLLATLETDRLAFTRNRAAAQVTMQQQIVNRLETGSRPQEIRQAEAQVEAARATLADATRSHVRVRDLVEKHLASPQELDDADAALKIAAAELKVALETLALVREGPRVEDLAAARATLQAFQADLDLADVRLAEAQLLAPAAGVIRDRILEPGDMASPNRPVLTLAKNNPVWVRAYIDEPYLGKLKPGMTTTVLTDSFPDKTYAGWVGYISPTAEFTPKTVETAAVRTHLVYQVRVFVCNPNNELRLGMPATVVLPLAAGVADAATAGNCAGD